MIRSHLDRSSTMRIEDYNPAYVIQTVNELQPLGKDKALEEIDSYLLDRDKRKYVYGLFWVLRVLFETPPELGYPQVQLGTPNIPPPVTPGKLPLFPIVIVRDIPFLVVRGYYLRGRPEPMEVHVTFFRIHGTVRKQPLVPPISTDGIEEEFLQLWKTEYGDAYIKQVQGAIRAQIARLGSQ